MTTKKKLFIEQFFQQAMISLVSAIMVFLANTALAYDCNCSEDCSQLKGGFYIGASAGYEALRIHEVYDLVFPNNLATFQHTGDHFGHGGAASLFLGYGTYLSCFYLGGEVIGTRSWTKDRSFVDQVGFPSRIILDDKRKIERSYGICFLPGYKILDNLLVYGRVGYSRGQIKYVHEIGASILPDEPILIKTKFKDNKSGVIFGLGAEFALCRDLSLRIDYIHSHYGTIHPADNTKVRLSTDQLLIGLVYHFGCLGF